MLKVSSAAMVIVVLSSASSLLANDPKIGDEIKGQTEASHQHGRIRWRSQATARAGHKWEYDASVENYDTGSRCRVRWPSFSFESFVPAGKTLQAIGPTSVLSAPSHHKGKIYFNGGPAAGEGHEETKAWIPESKTVKEEEPATKATARVYVDEDDKLHLFTINATSVLSGSQIVYSLSIETEDKGALAMLEDRIGVCWYSAWSEEMSNQKLVQPRWEKETRPRFLTIANGQFAGKVKIADSPVLRQSSVTLEDAGGNVRARAWLPAYSSQSTWRLRDPADRDNQNPIQGREPKEPDGPKE